MQCSEIRDMLSAYIDEVLDPQEKAAVEAHLKACSSCSQELADLQETVKLLHSLSEVLPPEGFRALLRQRLEKEAVPVEGTVQGNSVAPGMNDNIRTGGGIRKRWKDRLRHMAGGYKKYLAAAVIIIGFGISIGLYNMSQSGLHSYGSPDIALNQGTDSAKAEGSAPMEPDRKASGQGVAEDGASGDGTSADGAAEDLPTLDSMRLSRDTAQYDSGISEDQERYSMAPPGKGGEVAPETADKLTQPPDTPVSSEDVNNMQAPDNIVRAMRVPDSEQPGAVDTLKTEEAQDVQADKAADTGGGTEPAFKEKAADTEDDLKAAKAREETPSGTGDDSAGSGGAVSLQAENNLKPDQKIIKEGFLNLEVRDYNKFGPKLLAEVDHYGGYVENSSESMVGTISANIIIRVPARNFSQLLSRIESLGKVTDKTLSGRDVSTEYVDVQSRIRNLERQEQRLLGLVDKAAVLNEVLTLENELSRVREEIEVLRGRLAGLEDTTTYSTIRLEVREIAEPEVKAPEGILGKALRNFKKSLTAMLNLAGELVSAGGWLLPWVLVAGGAAGAFYWYRKKKG